QQDLQQAQFAKDVQDSFAKQLNAYRQSKGLSPLVWNQDLADFESDRAESIANGSRSDQTAQSAHDGAKTGIALTLAKQGKVAQGSENESGLVMEQLPNPISTSASDVAKGLLNNWINSPLHNKNQVNPNSKEFGFGIAFGQLSGYRVAYAYTAFATPLPLDNNTPNTESDGSIKSIGTYQDAVNEWSNWSLNPLSESSLTQYHAEPHVETFDDIKANADA
ncbi:CAP domain-containing protein, partial [Fructobacillus tropaeoli]